MAVDDCFIDGFSGFVGLRVVFPHAMVAVEVAAYHRGVGSVNKVFNVFYFTVAFRNVC